MKHSNPFQCHINRTKVLSCLLHSSEVHLEIKVFAAKMSSVSQPWVPEAANNYQDSHTRACTRIVTLQLGAEAIIPSINSEDFFGPVAEPKR